MGLACTLHLASSLCSSCHCPFCRDRSPFKAKGNFHSNNLNERQWTEPARQAGRRSQLTGREKALVQHPHTPTRAFAWLKKCRIHTRWRFQPLFKEEVTREIAQIWCRSLSKSCLLISGPTGFEVGAVKVKSHQSIIHLMFLKGESSRNYQWVRVLSLWVVTALYCNIVLPYQPKETF